MFAAVCLKYLEIAKVQIKLTLRMNLLLSLMILAFTVAICGVNNLDSAASSFALERFAVLIGIVLLTPIFLPEQDKSIAETAESKYTSIISLYFIRFILAAASILILISGFVAVMILSSCEFDAIKFIFGTFATAFFLGALGFAAYAITDNIVAGYLLPLGYYVFNMFSSSKQLKNFYLFTLNRDVLTEKYYLLAAGVLLIAVGIIYKRILIKIR